MVKTVLACILSAALMLISSNAIALAGCAASYVPSVNAPYTSNNLLYGVVAFSLNDAWAAGYANTPNYNNQVTLAEHYSAGAWSAVPTVNPTPYYDTFSAIDGVSRTDLWAIGGFSGANGFLQKTLAEHWDGKAFKVVPSPNMVACHSCSPYTNLLFGVAAISANDAWAVGEYTDGIDIHRALAMHWDGHTWSFINPMVVAEYSLIYSVTKIAHNDVWAAGIYRVSGRAFHPLFLHWNGSQWTQIPGVDVGSGGAYIYAISAASRSDVWAIGPEEGGYPGRPVAEHWNGVRWSAVRTDLSAFGSFSAVTAISPTNAWAMGRSSNGTLVEHWNGSAWSVVPSANPGQYTNLFNGASRIPGTGEAWGVGYDYPTGSQPYQTLTELAHC